MKRRTFLASVGASAAAALGPSLIRRAVAGASFDAPGTKKTAPGLATSPRRIDASVRPQLVIVVPADDEEKYRRGELWGEYLNHGTPSQIAPLDRVDVSCATMKELGALARGVVGEPLALLFERDGRVRALDTQYPDWASLNRYDPKADDAIVDKRIMLVSKMVASALPMQPFDGVHGAAARVIRKVREQPPAGSHWANASGCGPASVEGMKDDEAGGVGCGMGHVPEKSSRFLYFFAKTPWQMEREEIAAEQEKAARKGTR